MSRLAIEIHDLGLLAVADSAAGPRILAESPGYALLDGETLHTGLEATKRARLRPRHVHNRFWQDLDTEPLGRPFRRRWSAADLAHAHLERVWAIAGEAVDSVLLAIPSGFPEHRLGVALGLAQAAGIPVAGMVDSSVASLLAAPTCQRVIHLDLHLHRCVATELAVGSAIVRRRVEILPTVGRVALNELWAQKVAEQLVRKTRFDPLHSAASEQRLHDRLPEWLNTAQVEGRAVTRFDNSAGEHAVEIDLEDLLTAVEPAYEKIHELVNGMGTREESTTLALSHHIASLPGLQERLAVRQECEAIALPPAAAALGALRAHASIETRDEEVRFVTRLPRQDRSTLTVAPERSGPAETQSQESNRTPTHLLHSGRAYPLTSEPVQLDQAFLDGLRGLVHSASHYTPATGYCTLSRVDGAVVVEPAGAGGSLLNGAPLTERATLAAGDRLRVGDQRAELILIAVLEEDGTP